MTTKFKNITLRERGFLTRGDDGLCCELVTALLNAAIICWDVLLLPKSVGLRKHRLYLGYVALLKAPVGEEISFISTFHSKMCMQNKGEHSKESFYCRRFIRKVERHLLVHHVLNSLLDLAISSCLMAVVQHGHHRIHAPEHFSQHLVLVRQGEAGWDLLGKGVVPLVCWQLSAEERKRHERDCRFRF